MSMTETSVTQTHQAEAAAHKFNVGGVFQDISQDTLFNAPTEEIQLSHGGLFNGWMTADLEADTFATTEGIKQAFGIGFEFAFVIEVDHELTIFQ